MIDDETSARLDGLEAAMRRQRRAVRRLSATAVVLAVALVAGVVWGALVVRDLAVGIDELNAVDYCNVLHETLSDDWAACADERLGRS